MFAFQSGVLHAEVNMETSGEFCVDFNMEDVFDAEAQMGASSVAPGPSHSQVTSARIVRRLRRKVARQTLLDAQHEDSGSDADADLRDD